MLHTLSQKRENSNGWRNKDRYDNDVDKIILSLKKRKWKVLFAPDQIGDFVSDIMCNQAGELTPPKKDGVKLIVYEYA